jgi:hypothetical protein
MWPSVLVFLVFGGLAIMSWRRVNRGVPTGERHRTSLSPSASGG